MTERDAAPQPEPTPEPPQPPFEPALSVPPQPAARQTNVKETIESIIVAFILAFIFRAFVLEPFVIPTGSMAPTLLGAHHRQTCASCGWQFDVDYPTHGDDNDIPAFAPTMHDGDKTPVPYVFRCPNCGFENRQINPTVCYGDRILVLKYSYLAAKPARWDVVVFKSPVDPRRYDYGQNYIKRLTGLPNEWLMTLDGNLYTSPDGKNWQVQAKPRVVQERLWRILYDNDHLPRQDLPRTVAWHQPWQDPSGGWQSDGRAFGIKASSVAANLEYDPADDGINAPFSDWVAYDQPRYGPGSRYLGINAVSDLKLAFCYTRQSGDGPLQAVLTKLDHVFVAEFLPDRVQLLHGTGGREPVLYKSVPLPTARGPMRVEFTNVDYRVTVRVNDEDLIATDAAEYAPDVDALLDADRRKTPQRRPRVWLASRGQDARVEHLSLWRDIYYTPINVRNEEIAQGRPSKPMHLGPDEYFVQGDNSAMSLDSRYWEDAIDLPTENLSAPPGVVPGRLMIGRAFFVYWPAGFRPFGLQLGIIPNFADMRFIH